MELVGLAAIMACSVGLGLAMTRFMLSLVLSFITRGVLAQDV